MRAVLLVCGLLVAAPTGAVDVKGNVLTLDDDEARACSEGGGCIIVPRAELRKALDLTFQRGREACQS